MKTFLLALLSIFVFSGCQFSEFSHHFYGTATLTLVGENKSPLPVYTVWVVPLLHPLRAPDAKELDRYYSDLEGTTDENGNLRILIHNDDPTSSCEGKQKTENALFTRIVVYYSCGPDQLQYQDLRINDDFTFSDNINVLDTLTIQTVCIEI